MGTGAGGPIWSPSCVLARVTLMPLPQEKTFEAHTHPRNDRYAPTDAGILLRVLLFVY
jgi:hypothetical protein